MIESLDNKKIKELMKLKQKKYRDLNDRFLVETDNLVREAKETGFLIETYSVVPNDYPNNYLISKTVMKKISDLESTNIVGVVKKNYNNDIVGDRILLLDEVQDPGNLGTIIRSALAFNVTSIVLGNNCCDLYNSKVLRATEGSIFYIPIIKMPILEAIDKIRERNILVYATNVVSGVDIKDVFKEKYAIIVGNEGRGVKEEYQNRADKKIYIPMNKNSESLNVAIATSIILYELNR